jgi:transcription antitermination factor NusG
MEHAEGLMWFALTTAPQREAHAEKALKDLGASYGFSAFTPLEHRYRRRSRFKPNEQVKFNTPAYPRYVFIGVDKAIWAGLPWHLAQQVTFIKGYLANSEGRPVVLSGNAVAQIMRASQTPLFDTARPEIDGPVEVCEVIHPGETVEVIGGLLRGVRFTVARRIGSSLIIEGQAAPIEIPHELVRRAS